MIPWNFFCKFTLTDVIDQKSLICIYWCQIDVIVNVGKKKKKKRKKSSAKCYYITWDKFAMNSIRAYKSNLFFEYDICYNMTLFSLFLYQYFNSTWLVILEIVIYNFLWKKYYPWKIKSNFFLVIVINFYILTLKMRYNLGIVFFVVWMAILIMLDLEPFLKWKFLLLTLFLMKVLILMTWCVS